MVLKHPAAVFWGKKAPAMAQVVRCSACQTQYQVKDELAGRKAKCKKCGQTFQIPAIKEPVAAAASHTVAQATSQTEAAAAASPHVPATASPEPAAPAAPEKVQCPHCGAWVSAEVQSCSYCRLDMRKTYGATDAERERERRQGVKFALIGIGATLVAAPVFFLMVAVVAGGTLALLASILIMQVGVALGSFTLACQLFKQEPPEPGEILKVVCYSNLSTCLLAPALFGGGLIGVAGATGLGVIIAALVCMFYIGMPVVPSILISVVYNVSAAILTVVWVVVLMAVFAGFVAATRPAAPADGPPAAENPM